MPSLALRSKLLPAPHGFSTREGGVSEGAFASLNLGFKTGDERAKVEQNFQRLASAAELSLEDLHTISQVHGDAVIEAAPPSAGGLPGVSGEADAVWTARSGAAVGVKTADCVPILIADARTRQVMAVHSGWRGTDAEIVRRAVESMVARGAKAAELIAAIGPCIHACCYEVSSELAERFQAKFGTAVVRKDAAKGTPHLDLVAAVGQSLAGAGLAERYIDVVDVCTSCDRRFFSHRRDRGVTGRHLSFIQCRF